MIAGIDTGLATFGWAKVDDATDRAIAELGVVLAPKGRGAITLDRARRAAKQATAIADRLVGCHTLVIERLSFPPGGANASVPISLSYGAALGVAAALATPPRILTIAPQKWQRLVQHDAGKRVDYPALYRAAEKFLRRRARAAAIAALDAINPGDRNHAIDAALLALVGMISPGECERIA